MTTGCRCRHACNGRCAFNVSCHVVEIQHPQMFMLRRPPPLSMESRTTTGIGCEAVEAQNTIARGNLSTYVNCHKRFVEAWSCGAVVKPLLLAARVEDTRWWGQLRVCGLSHARGVTSPQCAKSAQSTAAGRPSSASTP
jgi:hypothetical protein